MSVIKSRLQYHNYIVEEFFAENGHSLSSGKIVLNPLCYSILTYIIGSI